MSYNKIIALEGKGNSGKTATIRCVFELLKQRASSEPEVLKNDGDIKAILIINSTKIGIESQGDPKSRLEESLKDFADAKCQIIVCATRTRGMTVDWVNALPGYSVEWVKQSYFGDKPDQDKNNEAKAQEIAAKVLKAVNA